MNIGRIGLLVGVALASISASAPPSADLILRGGTIYTGSDAPFVGDVAIKGDHIVEVSPHVARAATRVIDAHGMIVAPGFIDPHTHMGDDLTSDDPARRLIPMFLTQGVTTAFIGNDGGGEIDVGRVLDSARTRPVGINYATYTGFGTIRQRVIGEAKRAPTPQELAQMQALVASAMCQGAIGLSTGLFYAPQSFSKTDEVVALAAEAGKRGGFYDSHIRDESSYTVGLLAAIDEEIEIARAAHIPAHVSHIKALGVDVQGQAPAVIARIAGARAAGLDITASQYPWSASGSSMVASLVPLWAQDGGRKAMLARFDDPTQATRLRTDMAENMRKRGGPTKLLISEGAERNRTLAEVAAATKTDPISAAIAVIRVGDPGVISFNQSEADIAAFMRQPWVMTDSDASPGHPRVYGSFARKYAKYVVADHVLTLREMIERSSSLTADTFGLTGRGHLKAGAFADVVVFDPRRYAPRATYQQPTELAVGVQTVLVNGVLAVDGGKLTGRAAGRALPHRPPTGTCP
ncbi:N-acyl-D-amino-acid deacylase family protein [Sphingomonas echinoides]|uniref:Amidohydrolase family protein n=1 Tax=Sphingomonas echinoides TaxID=59803 RepID=A0ABU4PLT9_9SPHN|nr:amidohydrolase family protein [Sphingomonas echinoides]MDX5985145.1 amidohydrolase family protein [Sphingomonas echinoides]